jgi:2-keto-4-pentenoate hydratase/2-oxohepta-3-ene-1,7-dioic acid hydratase in catechol pathway
VNGELCQQFSRAQMTWSPHRMVALLSRMTLQPGDVVFTGGFRRFDDEVVVRVGDVIESAVLPLGVIRNRVVN